ncbi:hypothetical protein LJR255_004391 [Pararhizobium sp. LjRoot255]
MGTFFIITELFRDWAAPVAEKARALVYWYFEELAQLPDTAAKAA